MSSLLNPVDTCSELAAPDKLADATEADAEQVYGLVGGEVAGPDVQWLHKLILAEASGRPAYFLLPLCGELRGPLV
ncbi:hypothetical protein [Streptomyces flaveolus]|uniref:hypothetical protein n=1 Tax=Streptomyces flaveolus TaxID=67297 RepID=UPI0033202C07